MYRFILSSSLLFLNISFAQAGKTPISEELDTAIVGGGLAGLTTAHRLIKSGHQNVSIFEAQERLGGRVFTYHDGQGYREMGGQDIDINELHNPIKELAEALRIKLFPYPLSKALHYFHGERTLSYDDMLQHAELARKKLKSFTAKKGDSLQDVLNCLFPEDNLTQNLILAVIHGYYGIDPEQMDGDIVHSLSIKLRAMHQYITYLSQGAVTDDIAKESADNFRVEGGSSTLINTLASHIGDNKIKRQHTLRTVKKASNGRYTLTFDKDGEKYKISANQVILALPFSVLRAGQIKLDESLKLPPETKCAIAEMPYATYAKVTIPTEQAFWDDRDKADTPGSFLAYNGAERFEISDFSYNQDNPGITVYFAGSQGKDNFTDAFTVKPDVLLNLTKFLERKFPAFSVDSSRPITSYAPAHDPYARGSWSTVYNTTTLDYAVGENGLRHFAQPAGNLFFAGEHTVDYSGHMTSAVLSGEIVSQMIIDQKSSDSND